MTPTCIIVVGPTAVGKTAVAIELAQYFDTAILSADSRQCYQELNIGVARPSAEELAAVPHHFIASHSIHQTVSAAVFEQYALQQLATLFQQHAVVVVTGGTGLYIKALCDGLDEVPSVPESTRAGIIAAYEANGLSWLQQEIQLQDPLFFESGEMANPQRMMRALEVKMATGKSILAFRTQPKKQRPFNTILIGLELPRPQLYNRINQRVIQMMEQGLLQEVTSLVSVQQLNALQTVGYTELFQYLAGNTSLETAVAAIQQNTRHYAKRQLTWFKKNPDIYWIAPDAQQALAYVKNAGLSRH